MASCTIRRYRDLDTTCILSDLSVHPVISASPTITHINQETRIQPTLHDPKSLSYSPSLFIHSSLASTSAFSTRTQLSFLPCSGLTPCTETLLDTTSPPIGTRQSDHKKGGRRSEMVSIFPQGHKRFYKPEFPLALRSSKTKTQHQKSEPETLTLSSSSNPTLSPSTPA